MKSKKKEYTAAKLAEFVKGDLIGDPKRKIKGVSSAENPEKNSIVFAETEEYLNKAEEKGANLVIVPESLDSKLDLIKVVNPRLAYARIASLFFKNPFLDLGIADSADIAEDISVGSKVKIGANAVIEKGVSLADEVIIAPGVYIGQNVKIGKGTIIYPNTVIEKETVIGQNVIIHSGAVIGADGFGYVSEGEKQHKIPHLGSVTIEDDVEIGANVTVDRGTNGKTIIGKGTKIDNLAQIAHNVEIGKNCLIVAQVGIAGSTELEDNVTLAGQVGIVDHKKIAKNSTVAAKSLVTKDIPSGNFYSGNPAQNHRQELKKEAAMRKTPKLLKEIKAMKKEIKKLKKELNN